jgi:hypothetical protein
VLTVASVVIMVVGAGIHLLLDKRPRTFSRVVEILLVWLLVIGGAQTLLAGLSHLLIPATAAASIGWAPGSPFQFEVGVGDVGLGVVGLMCIWYRGGFWLASGTAASIFSFGAGVGHVYQLVVNHDTAPNNAGFLMYFALIWPIVTMALLAVYMRSHRNRQASQRRSEVAPNPA